MAFASKLILDQLIVQILMQVDSLPLVSGWTHLCAFLTFGCCCSDKLWIIINHWLDNNNFYNRIEMLKKSYESRNWSYSFVDRMCLRFRFRCARHFFPQFVVKKLVFKKLRLSTFYLFGLYLDLSGIIE